VHLTLDMAGQARFGPDVEWVDHIDYAVDAARAERFYPAIRKYWPTLPDGALMPSYSGMRPKIVPPAVASQDFLIQGPRDHGVAGTDQSVRNRIARTDVIAGDRRPRRRTRGKLTLLAGAEKTGLDKTGPGKSRTDGVGWRSRKLKNSG